MEREPKRSAVEKLERRQVITVFAQSYINPTPQLVLDALQEATETTSTSTDMTPAMDIDHGAAEIVDQPTDNFDTTSTYPTISMLEPTSAKSYRYAKTQVRPTLKFKCRFLE